VHALKTASNNTAVGASALAANTTGTENVALGSQALINNTTANNNVAIGFQTLYPNTTGANNTAVGLAALGSNTTGTFNTVLGKGAGSAITTGASNVCIGGDAGLATNLTTGGGNTLIGQYCHPSAGGSDNANGFGYDITAEGGYTTVGRAADDIRAAHGVATWATVSDERYKKDITDSTTGLSFINALQPRTFKYKTLGELPETFNAYEADSTEVFKNSDTNHGFIAQEVKAAIDADDSIKDGFKLWDDREDGSQEVAEAALIPVLVKAIQELSAQNDALTTRITALEG
jgi:trimeric autotransporter adhesin